MYKFGLYISGSKGFTVLKTFIEENATIDYVVTTKDNNIEIVNLCHKHNLQIAKSEDELQKVDYKIAAGWGKLIQKFDNLIVFHDSLLPQLRGFSPLITAIEFGHKTIGSSVFKAESGIDTGDIFYQKSNSISYPIKIQKAIDIILKDYEQLSIQLLKDIQEKSLPKAIQQIEKNATYSLWRNEEDYNIDWTLPSLRLQNFINAVGPPFKGAFTTIEGKELRILEVDILPNIEIVNRKPGKILTVQNNQPQVVTVDGLIKIVSGIDSKGNPFEFNRTKAQFK